MKGGIVGVFCGVFFFVVEVVCVFNLDVIIKVFGFKLNKWVVRIWEGNNYVCKCYFGDYCWFK